MNLQDLAVQKNAEQSLGFSGSDCQRECKFVAQYDPARPPWDRGMLGSKGSCKKSREDAVP